MGDDATPRRRHARADRGDGRAAARVAATPARSGSRRRSGEAHTDGDGAPVPSRAAQPEEFLALAGAVRDHAGTTLEFIPAMGEISDERIELMADMSLAADRPLNWNLLGSLSPTEVYEQQLTSCRPRRRARRARRRPRAPRRHADPQQPACSRAMPGWGEVVALPDAERRAAVADPAVRERLRAGLDTARERGVAGDDAVGPRRAARRPQRRRRSPPSAAPTPSTCSSTSCCPTRCRSRPCSRRSCPPLGVTDESWEVRGEVWRDERVVLGGSDAGAHVDLMCHANYPSVVLGELVRDARPVHAGGGRPPDDRRARPPVRPARPGSRSPRARTPTSWCSTPTRIGSEPAEERHDLPGGRAAPLRRARSASSR